MKEMQVMNVKEFTDELASSSPAPGGGSVAALCGSLSAALSSMVFNLTFGKKMYNEYDAETQKKINDGIIKSVELKNRFLKLMDEDVEAFNEVMAAFKLPKDTDEQKAERSIKIQESYVKAAEVPMKVAKETREVFDLLEISARYGNPHAISDAGVGAILALSCVESAILNIRINLGGIKNEEVVENLSMEIGKLLEESQNRKAAIMKLVDAAI